MSSTVSCSSAAQSVSVSRRMPAQIRATPTGWVMNSSPDRRIWSAWRSQAKTKARSMASRSIAPSALTAPLPSVPCASNSPMTAKRSLSSVRWESVRTSVAPFVATGSMWRSIAGASGGCAPTCVWPARSAGTSGWRFKAVRGFRGMTWPPRAGSGRRCRSPTVQARSSQRIRPRCARTPGSSGRSRRPVSARTMRQRAASSGLRGWSPSPSRAARSASPSQWSAGSQGAVDPRHVRAQVELVAGDEQGEVPLGPPPGRMQIAAARSGSAGSTRRASSAERGGST